MNILNSERLILREWRESDSTDLYEYAKSDLVGPNAGWRPHKSEGESKDIIKMFIDNDDTYAIVLRSENKVIGGIGLHNRKPDEKLYDLEQREIGYVLNPKILGKWICSRGCKLFIRFLIIHIRLQSWTLYWNDSCYPYVKFRYVGVLVLL